MTNSETASQTLVRLPALSDAPIRIAIIIGSTREGRRGHVIGDWFSTRARARDDAHVDVIDLAGLDPPAVLPLHPDEAVAGYLARIDQADAFVIITPEYNHGYPAALKQAIDLPRNQWKAKPVALVSYGGLAGGLRAVEQLRQVFAELHTVTMRNTVSFHQFWQLFDENGHLRDPASANSAATVMLDELTWWATTLRAARLAGGITF